MSSAITISAFLESSFTEEPFFGVIGDPVAHSMSPLIHNAALRHLGLNGTYHALHVTPDQLHQLPKLFSHSNFRGCNVTLPHKQSVIGLIDEPDSIVQSTGACNTIWKKGNKLHGTNTDVHGFLAPLRPHASELKGTTAVVFGTGGASKAIIYALKSLGFSRILQVSRTPGPRTPQNSDPDNPLLTISYGDWPRYSDDISLFVNSTPLGMHPKVNESPVPAERAHLLKSRFCYDIVYRPRKTLFLKLAEMNGGIPIDGLPMFLGQAAKAFELFTGAEFPMHIAEPILLNKLEESA